MTDTEAEQIKARLALVERSIRRSRAALAATCLIAAAALAGPALVGADKSPDTLRAKKFELVDDSGTVRAAFSTTSDGSSSNLQLTGKAGEQLALLATDDGECG